MSLKRISFLLTGLNLITPFGTCGAAAAAGGSSGESVSLAAQVATLTTDMADVKKELARLSAGLERLQDARQRQIDAGDPAKNPELAEIQRQSALIKPFANRLVAIPSTAPRTPEALAAAAEHDTALLQLLNDMIAQGKTWEDYFGMIKNQLRRKQAIKTLARLEEWEGSKAS